MFFHGSTRNLHFCCRDLVGAGVWRRDRCSAAAEIRFARGSLGQIKFGAKTLVKGSAPPSRAARADSSDLKDTMIESFGIFVVASQQETYVAAPV